MRWWILDEAPIFGGAELFALRLARHLREQREDVTMFTVADSALAKQAAAAGIAVVDHPLPLLTARNAAQATAGVLRTRAMLRRARAADAAVLANTASAQAYVAVSGALLRQPPPILHLMHEQMTAARPTARAAFRRSGRVIATGANTAAVYRAALPGVRVGQLNNFLEAEAFAGATPPRGEGPPVVGVLGRMIREKGILEAVHELAAADGAWSRACIAAPPQDAEYAQAVQDLIAQMGLAERIRVSDWVEPLPFLDQVDVLLVPSTGHEGQPTVILEALARRRPVVVRSPVWSPDFDGLPVRPYHDSVDLAAALADLPRLDSACESEARRRFGPEQAVAALREALAPSG